MLSEHCKMEKLFNDIDSTLDTVLFDMQTMFKRLQQGEVGDIESLLKEMKSTLDFCSTAQSRVDRAVDKLIKCKTTALCLLNHRKKMLETELDTINSWADVPVDTRTPEKAERSSKPGSAAATATPENRDKNSPVVRVDGKRINMEVQIRNVYLGTGQPPITLVTVSNAGDLLKLPPGMLVFHTGLTVPKVVMTTGRRTYASVPMNCRFWDPEDPETTLKYARYNVKARGTTNIKSFYIDDRIATRENPEDKTRNFRSPDHSNSDNRKLWTGYGVFNKPTFGDSKHLGEQLAETTFEDALDMYQYNLWMCLVGLAHAQARSNNEFTPVLLKRKPTPASKTAKASE